MAKQTDLAAEARPFIVADDGDDHEVGAAFETTVTRAEDRLAGFGMGVVVCALAVAMLLFTR